MNVSLLLLAVPLVFFSACASNEPDLEVSVYHLKDTKIYNREAPLVRAEQQKRLRGAVSNVERNARKGEYFTVDWDQGQGVALGDTVKVVLLYRQAATASEVYKMEREYPIAKRKGVTDFSLTGDEYKKNGRVLNWRSELYSGDQLLAYEQSYLWQ